MSIATPPAAKDRASPAERGRQPLRADHRRRRLALSLLLSLALHALLLGLTFGGDAFGLPGFAFPWEKRRAEVPDLPAAQPAAAHIASLPTSPPPAAALPAPADLPAAPAGPLIVRFRAAEVAADMPVPTAVPRSRAPFGGEKARAAAEPGAALAPATVSTKASAPARPERRPFPSVIALAQSVVPEFVVPAAPAQEQPVESPRPEDQGESGPAAGDEALAETPVAQIPAQPDRQEKTPVEIERQLATRLEAAQRAAEAEREAEKEAEAARRQAAENREAARLAASRNELAQQEARALAEAAAEAERQQLLRQQTAQAAAERLAAERRESARIEAARRAAEADELARQEAARQEAIRNEVERREVARQEAVRAESTRQETERREHARQEAARQEAARQEAARQEAAQAESGRRETERRESLGQEGARAEEERQESERQKAARQEQDARRDAARRAMGRQLDEEAARRAAEQAARERSPSAGALRRGRLFGRSDANAEMIKYAEAWARKIHFNTAFDTVRELARQPHTQPVVTVAIRSDGSVESVTVIRSSGVPAIDEAIRRIIEGQTPYLPFQPALAREFDVIEIRRTWHVDTAIRLY